MRSRTLLAVLLVFCTSVAADEFDPHRLAVLRHLLLQIPRAQTTEPVFVRSREQCWSDPSRGEGCVDLTDDVLDELRSEGFTVSLVPDESRYYIYGHPSKHKDEFNPPPPDWLYLPIYTPAAQWKTYCEVEFVRGLYANGALHVRGHCYSGAKDRDVLAGGDFLVRVNGGDVSVEPFQPPPGCVLPEPPTRDP